MITGAQAQELEDANGICIPISPASRRRRFRRARRLGGSGEQRADHGERLTHQTELENRPQHLGRVHQPREQHREREDAQEPEMAYREPL
jgi:hypothetical protein